MPRFVLVLPFAAVLLLACSSSDSACSASGPAISIHVVDGATSTPLCDAVVKVDGSTVSATSSATGSCTFDWTNATARAGDQYTVDISHAGYADMHGSGTLPGQGSCIQPTVTLDYRMSP